MVFANETIDETDKMITVPNGVGITPSSKTDSQYNFINIAKLKEAEESIIKTKLYKRRWLQLGLFFIYAACNSMQWIQFTVIGNVISRYYAVSTLAVDWTALLYHVMYIIMWLPASYVMPHVGLRWTCLIGAIGTSIGSWIKYFSVYPDCFVPAFIGQALVASCQVFVLTGPPQLAAKWFGPNEVATATAIGFSGVTGGISLFFFITPFIVKNHENPKDIQMELSAFFAAVAVLCTAVTAALFLFFQEEPRLPPSKASGLQKLKLGIGNKEIWSKIRGVVTNRSFLMLWNSYGINAGFLNVVSTLLNPLFLAHYQNGEREAGTLGLLMNLPGNFGSIAFCMILDRMKNFKAINIFINVFTLVGQILFAVGLIMEIKWLIFVAVFIIGVFTISCGCISFELSVESTYPVPEELSSGILNLAQQVYGTTLVLIVGNLLRTYGDMAAHAFSIAILMLGTIISILTKNELRRENARERRSSVTPHLDS